MATVKFVPNPAGFRELLTSPGVSGDLKSRADRVAAQATSTAPRDSGEYAAGIEVVMENHRDRVVAHVVATAPHSMRVEANTGNLARSLDAAGG